MHTATHHAPMTLPPVLTEIAGASLAAATERAPCPPLWRCGPCDYSTASAAEYTAHTGDQTHMGRIARARMDEFLKPVPAPPLSPLSAPQYRTLGETVEAAGYVGETPSTPLHWHVGSAFHISDALLADRVVRDLLADGYVVVLRPLPNGFYRIRYAKAGVARPRPVHPDVGDAVHEWAEAADAEQAHDSAVAHGGA